MKKIYNLQVEESSPPMRNNRDETQLKIPNLPKEVWSNQSIILTVLKWRKLYVRKGSIFLCVNIVW